MRALFLVSSIGLAALPARADDGPLSVAVSTSPRLGPVPGEVVFRRLDATAARTWWGRLHVGAGASIGDGGYAQWFAQGFVEAGSWLEPSPSLAILLGWRAGAAHFAIGDMRVDAALIESVAELRFRAGRRLDVRFAPLSLSVYKADTMDIMLGPELGLVVRL